MLRRLILLLFHERIPPEPVILLANDGETILLANDGITKLTK